MSDGQQAQSTREKGALPVSPSDIERERRITRLETRLDGMAEDIHSMAKDVKVLTNTFQQAKGAKVAFYGFAGLIGFLSSRLPNLFEHWK